MAGSLKLFLGFDTRFFAGEGGGGGGHISVGQDFETRHWDLCILVNFCSFVLYFK